MPTKKATKKKKPRPKMDGKLVSKQKGEIAYLAKKTGKSPKEVRAAQKLNRSRKSVEGILNPDKARKHKIFQVKKKDDVLKGAVNKNDGSTVSRPTAPAKDKATYFKNRN